MIAVKSCKAVDDIPDRTRTRWTQECEIMLRMNHTNVVRGYPLPPELGVLATGTLPVLSMEFCQQGDLRKVGRGEGCGGGG